MIERYIQITCDGCGEIEWSPADIGMAEFKAEFIPGWKHRGRKSLCKGCVMNGVRWKDATMHDWTTTEDNATHHPDDNRRV